jgi:hypothetical protein
MGDKQVRTIRRGLSFLQERNLQNFTYDEFGRFADMVKKKIALSEDLKTLHTRIISKQMIVAGAKKITYWLENIIMRRDWNFSREAT